MNSASTSTDAALAWCLQPILDLSPSWRGARLRHALLRDVARPVRLPRLEEDDGVLFATTTLNQGRTLDPITSHPTPVRIARFAPEWMRRSTSSRATARVRAWGDAVCRAAGRPDIIDVWRNTLAKTDLLLRTYRHLDLSAFSSLVVATQHDPQIRALILASQEQGLPVVYFPHAPVADNPQYSDLPVAFAGLRGQSEREFYTESFDVGADRLEIVGNPASDVLAAEPPPVSSALFGVLALSAHPISVVRRIVAVVAEGGAENVVVAPHPRSVKREIRRVLPTGWRLSDAPRTLDILRAGVRFVIQPSSGVAWESVALGIPTANLCIDDRPVSYPFLADATMIPPVRSADDVRRFIRLAPDMDRMRLRSHALDWCSFDGMQAVTRARELIAGARDHRGLTGNGARILDGWNQNSGVALHRSWLTARDLTAPA
jgi:hypothetical protein